MKKVFSIFMVALMLTGAFGALISIGSENAEAAGLADSAWPCFHGNAKHTGLSPYDTSNNAGTVKWNITIGYGGYSSPSIGSDGTIYIGSGDGKLYAINPDGTLKWNYAIGYTSLTPTVDSDGTIYIGPQDYKFYAINTDGTLKWTLDQMVYSSPAIGSDGTLYLVDYYLDAINPDGTLKWRYNGTTFSTCSSPAIGSDGTIYVGGANYHDLYAINANGELSWSYSTGADIYSSPAIGSDGTVYVGSDKLYAINPDGTLLWSYTTGSGERYSSPAIGSDGVIYVGTDTSYFYAINPDGRLKWNFDIGDSFDSPSSPAIGYDGTIYFGTHHGSMYAINPDGTLKWASGESQYYSLSSPAIGEDGTVYIASNESKLYAFGTSESGSTVDINIDSVSPQTATPDNCFIDVVDSSSDNPDSVEHYLIYPDGYESYIGSGGIGGWGFDLSYRAEVDGKALVEGTYTVKDVAKKSGYTDGVATATFYYSGPTVPAAPYVYGYYDSDSDSVFLRFNTSAGDGGSPVTSFNIYRGTSSGSETYYDTVTGVSYGSGTYYDYDVVSGQTYYYRVTAVNSEGEGAKSEEVSVTVEAPSGEIVMTVTALPDRISSGETSTITVHITDADGNPINNQYIDYIMGSITWQFSCFNPSSGYTDSNGDFITTYTAPEVPSETSVGFQVNTSSGGNFFPSVLTVSPSDSSDEGTNIGFKWQYSFGSPVTSKAKYTKSCVISSNGAYIAATNGEEVVVITKEGRVATQEDVVANAVSISGTGQYVAAVGSEMYYFDVLDRQNSTTLQWSYDLGGWAQAVDITPDGRYISTMTGTRYDTSDADFFIFENDGTVSMHRAWQGWNSIVDTRDVAISNDGRYVATASGMYLMTWDRENQGDWLEFYRGNGDPVSVDISSDGNYAVAGYYDNWDEEEGSLQLVNAKVQDVNNSNGIWDKEDLEGITSIDATHDVGEILVGTESGAVYIFNRDGSTEFIFQNQDAIKDVAIAGDGSAFAFTDYKNKLEYYQGRTLKWKWNYPEDVNSLSISDDGKSIVIGTEDGSIFLFGESLETEEGKVFTSQKISALTGGKIEADGVSLSIPAGALTEDSTVTISASTATQDETGSLKLVSNVYDFECDASFSSSVTVTISYSESDIPEGVNEEDLAIYTYQNGEWVNVGGVVDTEANTITVELSHFSMYAAMAPEKSGIGLLAYAGIVLIIAIAAIIGAVFIRKKKNSEMVAGQYDIGEQQSYLGPYEPPEDVGMQQPPNLLPPPPLQHSRPKPTSGKCSVCGSRNLTFSDDGTGRCLDCGRTFWWDKALMPPES